MGFLLNIILPFKMSIASNIKYEYRDKTLSLQELIQKLKSERTEKIIESKEDGSTTILFVFCDNSKLKVTEINNNLYYTEI
jgi:hypothetical protein